MGWGVCLGVCLPVDRQTSVKTLPFRNYWILRRNLPNKFAFLLDDRSFNKYTSYSVHLA